MPKVLGKFEALPQDVNEFTNWSWDQIEPFYVDLAERTLNIDTVDSWLRDWSWLSALLDEALQRKYVATTRYTADKSIQDRFEQYNDNVYLAAQSMDQRLKQKLINSQVTPPGFEIALRNMVADAALFRADNLPLLAEEQKLLAEYNQIYGLQTVEWNGKILPLVQVSPLLQAQDQTIREKAWRVMTASQQSRRKAYNHLWRRLMALRSQISHNADLTDFRAYRWQQMYRFDYTPDDCKQFDEAIEVVVVPVAKRIAAQVRAKLAIETLRPWDMGVEPDKLPPLQPFKSVAELEDKAQAVFSRIDPQFGAYFETMRREDLLDLDIRKHKAGGGYCTTFIASNRPFIFMNATSQHGAVQTLLHEGGHSFHVFEAAHLPYFQQRAERYIPSEFAEVASTSMELLCGPYLSVVAGGFYSKLDAARAERGTLLRMVFLWSRTAMGDMFQHWIYENQEAASDPTNCDAKWQELYQRFFPYEDWRGLEEEMKTGWHRILHLFQIPMVMLDYAMAQLGAVQVWRNALQDQEAAVRKYRQALALGASVALPALYEAAGAKFVFNVETLSEAVSLIEQRLHELDALIEAAVDQSGP